MSFLALFSVAGPLLGKLFHLKKGGEIHVKKSKQALVVVHDGEMVVPKKDVAKVKNAMKKDKINVPKPKHIGEGKRRRK